MVANAASLAQRGWGMLKLLMGLGMFALLAMCYMDVVFLPQKNALEEAQATAAGLGRELANLRKVGGKQEQERKAEQDVIHQRLTFLESLVRDLDPGIARKMDAHQEAFMLEQSMADPSALALAPPFPPPGSEQAKAKTDFVDKGKETKGAKEKNKKDKKQKQKKVKFPWRDDAKCGLKVPASEGTLIGCNPGGEFPCCSLAGWCGKTDQHCTCDGCLDFRTYSEASQVEMKTDTPYDQLSPKHIALVVPFRDRAAHLEKMREKIEALVEAWSSKNIKHTWMLFIVEQFDNELFNRGWLFNVGFKHARDYAKDKGRAFDCVVMHDVDILPTTGVDYGWCQWPNQLSGEIECWQNSVPYPTSTGGVISLSPAHWNRINGFSNEYQGWGGEDDDLYERLRQNGLLHGNCHKFCESAQHSRTPMVVRPPIGKGRFTCLSDGDHTPRLRNQNDQAMWSRLNAMKGNSQRWREDGISSIPLHHAGQPLESPACEKECEAPEDPTPRKRLFGEYWVRASMKALPRIDRIKVILPQGMKCADEARSLKTIPVGVAHLRRILPELFGKNCELDEKWADKQNFVLIDAKLGQSVLVGSGSPVVQADLALPLITDQAKESAPKNPKARDPEYIVQGQRLGRWIRRLPAEHTGWITLTHEPLAEVYASQVKKGNMYPQTVPACIAHASLGHVSQKKFRVTPGSIWCGDGGWTSSEHFTVLRSNTSVPKEKLFPICIGYNSGHHTYRFENSAAGCVGRHSESGTKWSHVGTMHTSTDATGDEVCVGQLDEGPRTRWMMKLASNCAVDGFYHKFRFSAMAPKYSPALVPFCLFKAEPIEGSNPLMRLTLNNELGCQEKPAEESGFNAWTMVKERSLLARRQAKTDVRLCIATASVDLAAAGATTGAGPVEEGLVEGWRLLRDKACDHSEYTSILSAKEGEISVTWKVRTLPKAYVPASASGPKLCACRVSDHSPARDLLQHTLTDLGCVTPKSEEEFCFSTLSGSDLIKASYVLDEPA